MVSKLPMFAAACVMLACGGSSRQPDPQLTYVPCAGKVCGDRCNVCAPNAYDCGETGELKYCHADGGCSGPAPVCP